MSSSEQLHPLIEEGDQKAGSGDPVGAVSIYDRALDIWPGNVTALSHKAEVLLGAGDFSGALDCYDTLVERDPRDVHNRVARSRILAQLGRYDEALRDIDAVLDMGGSDAISMIKEKGGFLRRAGRPAEAVKAYQAALAANNTDPDILIGLGDAHLDVGSVAEAVEAFLRASRIPGAQFASMDWVARGDRLLSAGRLEDAATLFNSAIQVSPSSEAWRGLAELNFARENHEDTLRAAEKACDLDAENDEAWNLRGCALERLGQVAAALECFSSATRIASNVPTYWLNQALMLDRLERFDDEIAASRRALELDATSVSAWSQLFIGQYGGGDFDAALQTAVKAIEVERGTESLTHKAYALLKLNRLEEAIEVLDQAIELDDTDSIPWGLKAEALARLDKENEARAIFDSAESTVSSLQDLLIAKYAVLSEWLGHNAEALEIARHVWEMDSQNNSITSDYAELLLKTGDNIQARSIAQRLVIDETKPSRACAMRFIVYLSYLPSGDSAQRNNAFKNFFEYFRKEFLDNGRSSIYWQYRGLRTAIRVGDFADEARFLAETLIDLQLGRIASSDFSYVDSQVSPDLSP